MNTEILITYIDSYGYALIFILLFFGIVGIPAPEESLLLLIGVLILHDNLSFELAILSAILGAFVGMLTAYICGKYIGYTFIKKYGKYIGITNERWNRVESKYKKNLKRSIVIGFYIPGVRQIIPYFAGIAHYSFRRFCLYSLLGSMLWITPYIFFGHYAGDVFDIDPAIVPYIGLLFIAIFIIIVIINFIRRK